jgi:Tfp pilus assembly protein FimT
VVVLAIVGIMASIAGPSFQSLNARLQARTATAEIASTLRMARQLAMARQERLLMRFDLPGKTISLQRADADAILTVADARQPPAPSLSTTGTIGAPRLPSA